MKFTYSVLVPAICWTARLASSSALVYIHDPQAHQLRSEAHSKSLGPVPARLVLAQRAGVEDYHASDISQPEVIAAINQYGVRTPLFAPVDQKVQNAFMLLEREGDQEDGLFSLKPYTSFRLEPVPTSPASRDLFVNLAKQSTPTAFLGRSDDEMYDLLTASDFASATGDVFYIARSADHFRQTFENLVDMGRWSITAIVAPPADPSVSRVGKSQWGTYEMPGLHAPLRKRKQMKRETLAKIDSFDSIQPFGMPVAASANNSAPLRGILPACFPSLSGCQSATRNCTGHGSCVKKYHDSTAAKDGGVDCFACACAATKTGGRTTEWGGPACQKKDISIQFWLITLFTVGMVFLIGFAIGTIWDMGQEELPSVIGAGVSGPTARK